MNQLTLHVDDVLTAAPQVRTVVLRSADGHRLPSFTPGSHIVLECGGRSNAYSLTGPSVEPDYYSVSVLHQRDGRGGSSWVHRSLARGDTVVASIPRSAFPPVLTASHHLLVAGGIGITAMLSHVRAALAWRRSFSLIYSYRDGGGAHLPELRDLCGERLLEVQGRVATRRHLTTALAGQPLGTHLYACGPAGLISAVETCARDAGWPQQRLHVERFAADELPPGRSFTATIAAAASAHEAASARAVNVPSGTSLLDALEESGFDVPNQCRQGVCGQCRVQVLAGRVEHRDLYLSPDERAAGDAIMACVSRGLDDTLELAL